MYGDSKAEVQRRSSLPSDGKLPAAKRECTTFEPQQWRPSVCKNCFRTQPEHAASATASTTTASAAQQPLLPSGGASSGQRMSAGQQLPPPPVSSRDEPTVTLQAGMASIVPPHGRGAQRKAGVLPGQRPLEDRPTSTHSPLYDRRGEGSNPSIHPTASLPTQAASGIFSSASSIDARYVEELENDFFDLEDKYDVLVRERQEIAADLEAKMRGMEEMQSLLENYKEKVVVMERRCAHLEEEIKIYRERLRLPESDQGGGASDISVAKASSPTSSITGLDGQGGDDLRQRLNQVEQLCQDVMEENEVLKEEIEEMQREIEEMHDHFQEEDRDSMREMQRDLEAANKTCRILQFKLKKAERRFEQCEAERASFEERLTRLESEMYSETDIAHIRKIEEELSVSKEVSMRLNNELDMLEEKKNFYEDENHQLKDELQCCQNRRIASENEVDRLRLELEKIKIDTGFSERGPLQVTDKRAGRRQTSPHQPGALSREPSQEDNELVRELQTAKEREADLSEQLRFAEEEVRKLTRRIAEAQSDNDVLSRQIERLNNMAQTANARGSSPRATTASVKKDLSTALDPSADSDRQRRFKLEAEISPIAPVDDRSAEKLKEAEEEQTRLKEVNKASTKRLNQLARELALLKANDKGEDWFAKYSEAIEAQNDCETQIMQLKKKLAEGTTDSASLYSSVISEQKSTRGGRSREGATKESLISELVSYEKELEELETELAAVKGSANSARIQIRKIEDDFSDYKTEAEQRERELRIYAKYLEKKDSLSSSFLELMVQRTEFLISENEKFLSPEKNRALTVEDTKLQERLNNMEKLLKVEQERSKQFEKELKAEKSGVRYPAVNENERTRMKELEMLKSQLDDKDEIIDDYESQIRDLNSRVDRAKKMNEAMKTLIDKDPVEAPAGKSAQSKQEAIEINSYRREIDSMRKEIAILQQKVMQMEKVREKLLYENKEMQEELKLREDSLFDQDDELEKRKADLAKAQRALELMQTELNDLRKENAASKTYDCGGASDKLGVQIAENERLKLKIRDLEEELKTKVDELNKATMSEKATIDRCRRLSEEVNSKEASIRERDIQLLDAKKEARRLDEELTGAKKKNSDIFLQLKEAEKTIAELQKTLAAKDALENEKESARHLSITPSEASPSQALARRLEPSNSPDSAIGGSREGTLRRSELDRLRREVSALRQERDEIAKEARKERQAFEKKLTENSSRKTSLTESQISLTTATTTTVFPLAGDLYAKAVAEKQMTTKLSLLNEHIARQTRNISEIKVQNESLQNKVLEYQRRYTNLKEQYEAEQEAWLTERVVLESKAKEQEDRKAIITSLRKSLQETSVQLAESESYFQRERQKLEVDIEKLEAEKFDMKVQLGQLKEQQKMPKVLQRFGTPTPGRSSHLSMINSAASSSATNSETMRRLESAERTIARLRADLNQTVEKQSSGSIAAVLEAEKARFAAESQLKSLGEQLVHLNLFREQAELFRERWIECDQTADREYKVWADEREDFLCRIEDSRCTVEQWYLRLLNREGNEYLKNENIVNEIVSEMERWRSGRQKFPTLQRRLHTNDYSQSQMEPTLMSSLASSSQANGGYNPLSPSHRSTSMEWSSMQQGYKGSNLSLAANFGVSPSLMRSSGFNQHHVSRCGRSVSPDVTVRKISNYPDPPLGFLVRSSSRIGSNDSITSLTDVSQKPFTMPGKPPLRQPISPARRKFFDESSNSETPSPLQTHNPPVTKLPSEPPTLTSVTVTASEKFPLSSGVGESSPLVTAEAPVKKKTPSVLSRISSKLTGSKSDLSKVADIKKSSSSSSSSLVGPSSSKEKLFSLSSKSPGASKKRVPSQEVKESPELKKKSSPDRLQTISSAFGKSPKISKKKSPERLKIEETPPASSSTSVASTSLSSTQPKIGAKEVSKLGTKHFEMPKLKPVSSTKTTPIKTTRPASASLISPSIMVLRQKFGGH